MDRWRPFSYTLPPPVSHICYTPQLSDKLHAQLPDMHRHATRGHNSRPTCYSSQICYMPQLSEDMLHATTLIDMLHAATVRHTLHATTLAMLLKCQTYASRHTCQTCKMQQNVFASPRLQSAWRGGAGARLELPRSAVTARGRNTSLKQTQFTKDPCSVRGSTHQFRTQSALTLGTQPSGRTGLGVNLPSALWKNGVRGQPALWKKGAKERGQGSTCPLKERGQRSTLWKNGVRGQPALCKKEVRGQPAFCSLERTGSDASLPSG